MESDLKDAIGDSLILFDHEYRVSDIERLFREAKPNHHERDMNDFLRDQLVGPFVEVDEIHITDNYNITVSDVQNSTRTDVTMTDCSVRVNGTFVKEAASQFVRVVNPTIEGDDGFLWMPLAGATAEWALRIGEAFNRARGRCQKAGTRSHTGSKRRTLSNKK